jgi:hypothetical protein
VSNGITRRRLIQWATGTAVVVSVERNALGRVAASLGRPRLFTSAPTVTERLVRAADQLDVLVEVFDADVVDGRVVATGTDPAIRFTFGPQHVTETGFLVSDTAPTAAIDAIVASNSIVVVPVSGTVDFTLAGLLDAAASIRNVDDDPSLDGSATELGVPALLVLSPDEPAGMFGSSTPFTVGDVTEVWTARIEPTGPGTELSLRAVANLDLIDRVPQQLPDADSRELLVTNSTTLAPLTAGRLWLSSAGAFTDLHGEWDSGVGEYDHQIVAGRDVSVAVSSLGYLLPFGHRAAVVEIGRRTFVDASDGGVAVVQVERFLTVIDPSVGVRTGVPDGGRGLPFRQIDVVASSTRPIAEVVVTDLGGAVIDGAVDIVTAARGVDHDVEYLATDLGGNTVTMTFPATFVADSIAHDAGPGTPLERLRLVMNETDRQTRREGHLGGQAITFAEPVGDPTSTTKITDALRLGWAPPAPGATPTDLSDASSPAVFAVIEHADIVDDLVGGLSGGAGAPIGVTFHPRWLSSGNSTANFDLAFLTLDVAASAALGDGVVASVASVELIAEVFNQTAGIGPDIDLPTSPWDPEVALGELSRIIGNIPLLDLIDPIALIEDAIPGIDIPGTTVTVDGDTVTIEFCWKPALKSLPPVGFVADKNTRCTIKVTTTASLSDQIDPMVTTVMEVSDFDLEFPPGLPTPLVVVSFDRVTATVDSTGAASVEPIIERWDFGGTISALRALVDALGLGDLDFQIVGNTIELDSSIQLPAISLGVVGIKHLGLATGLDLPIGDGNGMVSIGIGSKGKPVELEVMMFGGTFWLDVDVPFGDGGLPVPIISIGVSVYWEIIDLDILVASITFTLRLAADWRFEGADVVFTGSVALEGEVSLLGIAHASVALNCSLSYRSADEEMVLKGTVSYAVDTAFGSIAEGTVPLGTTTIAMGNGSGGGGSLRPQLRRDAVAAFAAGPATAITTPERPRKTTAPPATPRRAAALAGSSASFRDRYTQPVWADYCDAFA